jgi:predicted MFS family arabinose efflux permease
VKRIEPGTWTSIAIIYSQGALGAAIVTQGPPLLNDIVRTFHVSASTASIFVSLAALFPLFGLVLIGWVIDVVGGRRAMMMSSAIIFGADIWMYFAPSLEWLYSARFVESIGRTVCMAGGIGLLAATTSGRRRVQAMAIGATFGPVGLALGFAIGSPFSGTEHWRSSFIPHAAWAFIQIFAASMTIMPGRASASAVDAGGDLNPFAIYKKIGPLRLAIGCFAEVFVQHGLSTMLPEHFRVVHSLAPGRTSSYQAIAQLANIPGSLLTGFLLARGVPQLKFAWILAGTGIVGISVLLMPTTPMWIVLSALLLMNVALGGLLALLFNLVPSVSPDARSHSSTAGLIQQMAALGGFTGPYIFVLLMTSASWEFCAAAAAVGLVLMSTILPVWPRDLRRQIAGTTMKHTGVPEIGS